MEQYKLSSKQNGYKLLVTWVPSSEEASWRIWKLREQRCRSWWSWRRATACPRRIWRRRTRRTSNTGAEAPTLRESKSSFYDAVKMQNGPSFQSEGSTVCSHRHCLLSKQLFARRWRQICGTLLEIITSFKYKNNFCQRNFKGMRLRPIKSLKP